MSFNLSKVSWKLWLMLIFGTWLFLGGLFGLMSYSSTESFAVAFDILAIPSTLLYSFGLLFMHSNATIDYVNAANTWASAATFILLFAGSSIITLFVLKSGLLKYIKKQI